MTRSVFSCGVYVSAVEGCVEMWKCSRRVFQVRILGVYLHVYVTERKMALPQAQLPGEAEFAKTAPHTRPLLKQGGGMHSPVRPEPPARYDSTHCAENGKKLRMNLLPYLVGTSVTNVLLMSACTMPQTQGLIWIAVHHPHFFTCTHVRL